MPDDPIAEAGSEPLDLRDDCRRGITCVTVRHMRVGPQWMYVGSLRVGQILLSDKDERPLRPTAGVDIPLTRGDLGELAAKMDCALPARVRVGPRDATLNGEVDLERAGSPPESAVGAGDSRR